MIRYINLKTSYGVETIDALDMKDFKTIRDFRIELQRLKREYINASPYYNNIYISQRGTKR